MYFYPIAERTENKMDDNQGQRRCGRKACDIAAKIAVYVPLEYENFFKPGCFQAKIVNYCGNGLGIVAVADLAPEMVVCITPDVKNRGSHEVLPQRGYQSAIRWVRRENPSAAAAVSIGVEHIRD
jgi:hypothetical protein